MPATLARHPGDRPIGTRVRKLPPGRPTDLRILGFEGAFDAIVAETDDCKAMAAGLLEIQRVGSMQSLIVARMRATQALSERDDAILKACNGHLASVVAHLRERAERLCAAGIPEEQRIAAIFDQELSMRECAR